MLHASFTAAQLLTAMLWGRVAGSARFGRKTVVMIGLAGTMVSCIGFGFSASFWSALFFRSIGGITNGKVGVLRTMQDALFFSLSNLSLVSERPATSRMDTGSVKLLEKKGKQLFVDYPSVACPSNVNCYH